MVDGNSKSGTPTRSPGDQSGPMQRAQRPSVVFLMGTTVDCGHAAELSGGGAGLLLAYVELVVVDFALHQHAIAPPPQRFGAGAGQG